jgi:hypothetical protein
MAAAANRIGQGRIIQVVSGNATQRFGATNAPANPCAVKGCVSRSNAAASLHFLVARDGQRADQQQQDGGYTHGKLGHALAALPPHGRTPNGSMPSPRAGAVRLRSTADVAVKRACQ